MELVYRLAEIQRGLKAPKNQKNKFGGYMYRSCEDILEAVKPYLTDGLIVTISDEIVCLGGTQPISYTVAEYDEKTREMVESEKVTGGERFYVKATATITLDADKISVTAYAREEENKKGMDASQITGAASSYARKYALNGLFLIDDTKDADSGEPKEKEPPKAPAQPPPPIAETSQPEGPAMATTAQIQKIQILMKERKHDTKEKVLEVLSKFLGRTIASSKELTKAEASQWIELHDKKGEK